MFSKPHATTTAILAALLAFGIISAAQAGGTAYHSDGSSTTQIGNSYYNSEGSSTTSARPTALFTSLSTYIPIRRNNK